MRTQDADHLVFGQQVTHRGEPADRLEHTNWHHHRLAHDAGNAQHRSHRHAAGDEPVELEVFEDRAGVSLAHAHEEVRHQPDARLGQVAGRLAEVRRLHPHVGIADQDHVVLAIPLHRRQALDLRIQAERRAADDELGVMAGELGEQLLHHANRRVVGVGDAEEQLVGRVVELEEAAQVLLELFVEPLQRLVRW